MPGHPGQPLRFEVPTAHAADFESFLDFVTQQAASPLARETQQPPSAYGDDASQLMNS